MNPKRLGAISYPLVFLLRRTLFVTITFALAKEPGIQTQLAIFITLIYLIYIGYAEFYEPGSGGKTLEIINESIFVLIQYNFVLLHNLVWDDDARD